MPVDKWGIPFFYVSKPTAGITGSGHGFYWTQNNDIHKDDDYEGTAMVRIGKEHDLSSFKVIDTSTGEWQFPFNTSGDSLDLSGPTGHHTGGETHGCQGFAYMCAVNVTTTPAKFRFRKETYHVQYNDDPQTGEWTHPNVNHKIMGTGNWYGFGWVRYNKVGGRTPAEIDPDTGQVITAAKDSVICECWWNDDPVGDIANWKMLKRTEDKGDGVSNWGVSATCDGQAHQVGTWSNIQFRFKSDASDFSLHPLIPEPDNGPNINSIGGEGMSFSDSEARGYGKRADMPRDIEMKCLFKFNNDHTCRFKNVSLREIDPTLAFDDNPDTPPPPPNTDPGGTTTLIGTLKFQQDINTYRTSACAGVGVGGGGGGEVGNTIFYDALPDHDTALSDSSTFSNRTRVVEICKNSSSVMKGKLLKQLDVYLDKVGSPGASPTVRAKIWNSSGSLLYESPTQIDPTTLTTSPTFTKYVFDFSTNTHVFVTGDRVGVSYAGTSDVNYVECGYESATSPNTIYANFEGSSWDEKESRDFACNMWE